MGVKHEPVGCLEAIGGLVVGLGCAALMIMGFAYLMHRW